MFTLDQINDIHERLGKQATLPDYLRALKGIGVNKYDSFLTDGHSDYFGEDNQMIVSPPVYEKLTVAQPGNREEFLNHLKLHEQGEIDYFEMSKRLADSGIEKWTFDTNQMTITYYAKDGTEMLVEPIEL